MKVILCVSILGLGVVGFGKCAEPGETALHIVQKGIEAHGGATAIAKLKTAYVKSTIKGTFPKLGPIDMTVQDTFDLPNRFRKALKVKIAGQDLAITWAIDGNKCWYKDYMKTNGLNLPMKQMVLHNGQKIIEIDVLEVKLIDKLDDRLFEKPAK